MTNVRFAKRINTDHLPTGTPGDWDIFSKLRAGAAPSKMKIVPTVDGETWAAANIDSFKLVSAREVRVILSSANPNLSENMRGGEAAFIVDSPGNSVVILNGDGRQIFDSRD